MPKRKLWSAVSMQEAVECVSEGKGLREAAKMYNVPVETLRRRVNGTVKLDCKPGPATVLTAEEEDKICTYLIDMADMGYGLSRDAVMHIAYLIAVKSERPHPFTGESAGRSWFEGFMKRHNARLTIRTPLPLSYARAVSANTDTISDFFGKLGAIYGRLNLLSKPMQIFNTDETGISIVHRPGRVLTQLGRQTVYSVTSGEKGKTHTVLVCVSATGYVLPPLMVYPRKRAVPDKLKNGAVPNTLFCSSENGWINSNIYLRWLEFFVSNIPPTRPVLLIQDGHVSHMSIEAIEFARNNDIHILCLPSHTTHILQPLDVGVFKSFKSNFSKVCSSYTAQNPGRVITPDVLSSMVAAAWPLAITPLNIMSGFRKCGLFPFNPSAVDDRRLGPSKAFKISTQSGGNGTPERESVESLSASGSTCSSPIFTPEQHRQYTIKFQEGYDLHDPGFVAWLKINHPEKSLSIKSSVSCESSRIGNTDTDNDPTKDDSTSICTAVTSTTSTGQDPLADVLKLPSPRQSRRKKRNGVNSKAICLTDELESLKENKRMKEEQKEKERLERERKKQEREDKRRVQALETEKKKKEREEKKKEKEKERAEKKLEKERKREEKKMEKEKKKEKEKKDKNYNVDDQESGSEVEEFVCPKCNLVYDEEDNDMLWVHCDKCNFWFDFKCTGLKSRKRIPRFFYCESCNGSFF